VPLSLRGWLPNPKHRVRLEHNQDTLLVHIADEDGRGWTTVAIDRATREWSVAQRGRQLDAAKAAYEPRSSARAWRVRPTIPVIRPGR
jgi:hypothetical protein